MISVGFCIFFLSHCNVFQGMKLGPALAVLAVFLFWSIAAEDGAGLLSVPALGAFAP